MDILKIMLQYFESTWSKYIKMNIELMKYIHKPLADITMEFAIHLEGQMVNAILSPDSTKYKSTVFTLHNNEIYIAYSENGRTYVRIYNTSTDTIIREWPMYDKLKLSELISARAYVYVYPKMIHISNNKKEIFAVDNYYVHVFSTKGKRLRRIDCKLYPNASVAFSNDSKIIYVTDRNGQYTHNTKISLYDSDKGQLIKTWDYTYNLENIHFKSIKFFGKDLYMIDDTSKHIIIIDAIDGQIIRTLTPKFPDPETTKHLYKWVVTSCTKVYISL